MSNKNNSVGNVAKRVTDLCLAAAFTTAAVGTVTTGIGLVGGVVFGVPAAYFAKEGLAP